MTDNPYFIYGYVTCDKAPMQNATVKVTNHSDTSSASVQTNMEGKYQINVTDILDERELAYIEVTNRNYLFRANSYSVPKRLDIDLTDITPTDVKQVEVSVDAT